MGGGGYTTGLISKDKRGVGMSFKTSKQQIKAYYNIMNDTEGGQPRPPAAEQHGRDEEEDEDGRVWSFGCREGTRNQKGLLSVPGRLKLSKGPTDDSPAHRRGDVTPHRLTSSQPLPRASSMFRSI